MALRLHRHRHKDQILEEMTATAVAELIQFIILPHDTQDKDHLLELSTDIRDRLERKNEPR